MSESPKVKSIEYWIDYLFNRRVTDPAWYWREDMSTDWWQLERNEITVVSYLTRTFDNAGEVLKPFSNGQIAASLNYIIDPGASNLAFAVTNIDNRVEKVQRLKCFESLYSLYENLFAVRCSPGLTHRGRLPDENPLNDVCYMWWDVFPIHGHPKEPRFSELDRAILGLLKKILKIDSVACRESALHGLGHWAFHYPGEVKEIVNAFLAEHPYIKPELREYALNASWGNVQ